MSDSDRSETREENRPDASPTGASGQSAHSGGFGNEPGKDFEREQSRGARSATGEGADTDGAGTGGMVEKQDAGGAPGESGGRGGSSGG